MKVKENQVVTKQHSIKRAKTPMFSLTNVEYVLHFKSLLHTEESLFELY